MTAVPEIRQRANARLETMRFWGGSGEKRPEKGAPSPSTVVLEGGKRSELSAHFHQMMYETELDSTTGSVLLNRKGLESEKGLDKMKPIWYNLVIEAEEEAKKEVDLFAVSVYD